MPLCEKCGIGLNHKNKSPSEIYNLCRECWLKHPESKGYRKSIKRWGRE